MFRRKDVAMSHPTTPLLGGKHWERVRLARLEARIRPIEVRVRNVPAPIDDGDGDVSGGMAEIGEASGKATDGSWVRLAPAGGVDSGGTTPSSVQPDCGLRDLEALH